MRLWNYDWPSNCFVPEFRILVWQNKILELSQTNRLRLIDVDSSEQGFKLAAFKLDVGLD